MTIDHDKIRTLLTELIELPPEVKASRLDDIKNESPELYEELQSLLPFTEGDRDDLDNDPFVGEVVGHFTIKRRIGSGGMGRVYLARQKNPDRNVAFKVLRRGLLSRSASKRFEIECRLLGRLHHGGIAQVYEAGTHIMHGDRIPWIAMEYIEDAKPITAFAKDENLNTNEKLTLFKLVCEAVAEAHSRGIVHRDLKPANILVDAKGIPKIIDFGVAKAIDPMGMPTALRTQTTDLVGTMQYMSPEQASGESVDVTSDIYSLGVILYELLSGQRPYDLDSTTIPGAVEKISHSQPISIRTINKDVSKDLSIVVEHAMASSPSKRYRSANELCDDIGHVIENAPISARKESTIARFLRRRRRLAAAIVIALPILAIATATSVYFALQAQHELDHKTKLIEFAKEALSTRDEIIVTNPEYWKTNFDHLILRAEQMSGDDRLLHADMNDLLSFVADKWSKENQFRLKNAVLVGMETERGVLLAIDHYAYEGHGDYEKRISKITELHSTIAHPTPEFSVNALLRQGRVELRSPNENIRTDGRNHIEQALLINNQLLMNDLIYEFNGKKQLSWANIFQEGTEDAARHTLELLTPKFIEKVTAAYTPYHTRTLGLINLQSLAYERLGNFDKAIELLRPVAKTAADRYGVGHNITWRYLNNLAVALTLKSRGTNTSSSDRALLQDQAAALWFECIKQCIMRDENSSLEWYKKSFRDYLPEKALSDAEIDYWKNSIQFNGNQNFQDLDFRSVLNSTH